MFGYNPMRKEDIMTSTSFTMFTVQNYIYEAIKLGFLERIDKKEDGYHRTRWGVYRLTNFEQLVEKFGADWK